jgi:hypothetical protein
MPTTLYFDTCCLNRPFDDQSQIRIRLEAEAILLILSALKERGWEWIASEIVDFEVAQIPEPERRRRVQLLASSAARRAKFNQEVEDRAVVLEAFGFGAFDAMHIACAEAGAADVLLTTDDRMKRRAERHQGQLLVRVDNPLNWLQEAS